MEESYLEPYFHPSYDVCVAVRNLLARGLVHAKPSTRVNRDGKWSGLSDPQPFLLFLPFDRKKKLLDSSYVNLICGCCISFLLPPLAPNWKRRSKRTPVFWTSRER